MKQISVFVVLSYISINLSGIFLKVRAPRSTCPIMPEAMEVEGAVEEVKKIKEDNDPENEGAFMRLSHLRFRMTKSVLPPAHLPHKRPAARRLVCGRVSLG